MKKYIAPSFKVVNIESNSILAGSDPRPGFNPTGDPVGEMEVRGYRRGLSDFDDED